MVSIDGYCARTFQLHLLFINASDILLLIIIIYILGKYLQFKKLFTVRNNYLSIIKVFAVNNNCLPGIVIFTANKIIYR